MRRERLKKRARTDRDTVAESTQLRQKKGQMKSIFLSNSDEKSIVEVVKQNEELCKTHAKFKDKRRNEFLWERLAASRNLPVKTVKKWFDTQCTRYGKLIHRYSYSSRHFMTDRI